MNQSNITKTLLILSLLAAFMGFALPATAASTPPATAASTPVCGNGTLELEAGEICDEGSTSGDICTNNCKDLKEGWVCNLQRLCKENEVIDDGEACGDNTQNSCEECSEVINLGSWTKETYPLQGSLFSAEWGVHKGDLQVTLKTNQNTFKDDPNNSGFFILKDEPLLRPGEDRRVIELKLNNIHPTVKTDDDYIGVAFGIREGDVGNKGGRGLGTADPEGPADFILLQWKDSSQFEGKANEFEKLCYKENAPDPQGISLAHIRGIVTWNELWTRPTTPCKDNKNGSFTLLDKSDPRVNDDARIPYVSERVNPPAPPLPRGNRAKPEVFATLRVIYSKTRIQVFVDKFSNGNYKRVIDQPGKFPTHGNIGLFAMAQNAMTFTFLRPTENNIAVCRPERCGDGYVATTTASGILSDIAEECDPGTEKYKSGGCDALCRLEKGWECNENTCTEKLNDGLVVGKEECDEGPTPPTPPGCENGKVKEGWSCPPYGGRCVKLTLDTPPKNNGSVPPTAHTTSDRYLISPKSVIKGTFEGAELSQLKVVIKSKDGATEVCDLQVNPGPDWEISPKISDNCDLNKGNQKDKDKVSTMTVIGIDKKGNQHRETREIIYDKTSPTPSFGGNNKYTSSHKKLAITSDPDTKSVMVKLINVTDPSKFCTTTIETKGKDGKWTADLPEDCKRDGEVYNIEVIATDYAGNTSTDGSEAKGTTTVDLTPPTLILTKKPKERVKGGTTLPIEGTVDEPGTVTVVIRNSKGKEVCSKQTKKNNNF